MMNGLFNFRPEFIIAIMFLCVIAVIYVWDAYVLTMAVPGRSISTVLREWSMSQPILPFAVGVLIGHLFW